MFHQEKPKTLQTINSSGRFVCENSIVYKYQIMFFFSDLK